MDEESKGENNAKDDKDESIKVNNFLNVGNQGNSNLASSFRDSSLIQR